MRKRLSSNQSEKRMFDVSELAEYLGMGVTRAVEFGKDCGAVRHMGRRVLFDRKIIDKALDALVN